MARNASLLAPHPAGHAATPLPSPDRRMALAAGAGLLLIAALSPFGYVVVIEGLVTTGDPAQTTADINASRGLFALGVAVLYVAALLDVLVAWALLRVFEPVHSGLARLSAYLRVAYAAVYLAAISQLTGVPAILDQGAGVFSTEQLQTQALTRIESFHDMWFAGLILFGAHLAVLGLLVLRWPAAPRLLGALLILAGAGYTFDTFHDLIRPGTTLTVSMVTFLGEFLLALWLLARGGRTDGASADR